MDSSYKEHLRQSQDADVIAFTEVEGEMLRDATVLNGQEHSPYQVRPDDYTDVHLKRYTLKEDKSPLSARKESKKNHSAQKSTDTRKDQMKPRNLTNK